MTFKQINKGIQRELRDIIHGYVMSDGHITAYGSLQVRHSIKQRKFVEWLYKHLTVLRTPTPIRTVTQVDLRLNTKFTLCGFQTRNILQGFHSLWYKKSKVGGKIQYIKSLPANLAYFFNSTFLSVWFAGDGTKMIGQRGSKFEVTCYTPEERRYLQQLFKQKFDINAKILRSGVSKTKTTQWSLSIPAEEYEKFRNILIQMDLIPTLFPYKLCKKV